MGLWVQSLFIDLKEKKKSMWRQFDTAKNQGTVKFTFKVPQFFQSPHSLRLSQLRSNQYYNSPKSICSLGYGQPEHFSKSLLGQHSSCHFTVFYFSFLCKCFYLFWGRGGAGSSTAWGYVVPYVQV